MTRLTIDEARNMDFQPLIEAADELIAGYEAPATTGVPETQEEKMERLGRTIDEVPDIYRWLLTLESYFDHWTDFNMEQHGRTSSEYKSMRERRDAMERAAKAAKLRYEGASREITRITGFDESGTPRARQTA